ncbi:MAG: HEAT repeat domain-containing protein, partial [Bdellovibrionota bacterium]
MDSFSLTDAEQSRFARVQRFGVDGTKSIAELLEMLTDPSWVVRRSLVDALARLGESAVAPLIDLLRHKRDSEARIAAVVDTLSASTGEVENALAALVDESDPAIVADVAQILGRRRSPSAVVTLVGLTKHKNDNVSVGAIEALGRIGGRAAVEALIEIVGGRNFFRVFPAIDVLGRSGDPRSIAPLTGLLTDPTYLPEASRALGRSGERSAVTPLVELLGSSSDTVVRVAAASLWDLRDRFQEKSGGDVLVIDGLLRAQVKKEMIRRLSRLLPQSDTNEATSICRLLGVIGDAEAAPALTLALDADGAVAKCAAASLKKIGRDADSTMLAAIREGPSERRKILLPLVSRASAATEVALCLTDSDPEIRALACDTLARLANPSVAEKLFPLLEDGNLRVVHSATAAIQSLGTGKTRELAKRAAESKNPMVRRSALRILAYFGGSTALEPILAGLTDVDPRVREAAIHGLPFVDESEALEALYASARSEVPRTRALSMRSLGQLENGNETVYSLLLGGLEDADAWTRYYSCQSLGRLEYVPASSAVGKMLNDQAGQVRVAAVEALSHFDSPAAHEALRKAALRDDLEVRRAALVGLGLARRDEDLPVL